MASSLTVSKRDETGSLRMKRMRQQGQIPAVLYGGEGGSVMLALSNVELGRVIEGGSRQVQLTGEVTGAATIKSVQWNTFGTEVLHVDLLRG